MADNLSIRVDASDLLRRLDDLGRVMASGNHPDLEEGQRNAAAAYLDFVSQWFLSSGNGTWTPLKPETIAAKQRRGEDPRPGFGGGTAMYDSLSPGQPNNILEVDGLTATVGSSDPNIAFFQNGTQNTPPRPVFVDPDQRTLDAIAAAQLAGVVKCIDSIL